MKSRIMVLVAAAAASLVAPAAAVARPSRCVAPKGAHAIAKSADAVVTLERRGDLDPFGGPETDTWRGCLRAVGRQVVLEQGQDSFGGGFVAGPFRLAGRFVAYRAGTYSKYDLEDDKATLLVNLATGARTTVDARAPLVFAVNRLGDVAWIEASFVLKLHQVVERLLVQRGGRVRLVRRTSADLRGLRLGNLRVHWREHGRARSRAL